MGLKVDEECKAMNRRPCLYDTILHISYHYSMATIIEKLTRQDLQCVGTQCVNYLI